MTVADDNPGGGDDASNDWDRYRGSQEPEDHWQFRRQFLTVNQGKLSELWLFCLSTVFASAKTYGCKYPHGTAELIRKLSAGITPGIGGNDNSLYCGVQNDLSELVGTKSAGTEISQSFSSPLYPTKIASGTNISPNNVALQSLLRLETDLLESRSHTPAQRGSSDGAKYFHSEQVSIFSVGKNVPVPMVAAAIDPTVCTVFNVVGFTEYMNEIYLLENGKESARNVLVQSFKWCRKIKEYIKFDIQESTVAEEGGVVKCDLAVGPPHSKNIIFHGKGKRKKEAQADASDKALVFLRQLRPTILVKNCNIRKVKRQEIFPPQPEPPGDSASDNNSVAYKMMQAMGWKGGGLGRNQDGISAPISDSMVMKSTRTGLGYSSLSISQWQPTNVGIKGDNSSVSFGTQIKWFLLSEEESLFDQDIQFPSNFTKQERKIIHEIAQEMGLSTQSYGSGNKRHLIVSGKKMDPHEIFHRIMERGGETVKYKVRLP